MAGSKIPAMKEEMTIEQFQAEISKPKRHKFGAKKTEVDGFIFDSKAEAAYYSELKLRENAEGDYRISDLELQPKFPIVVNDIHIANYFADFRYKDSQGSTIVVDVKGMKTDVYRLKKKLVEAIYEIKITEIN